MSALEQALAAASPRLNPRTTPVASYLIHGTVLVLWFLLFARAFYLPGLRAWSTGIVYIAYDTLLLVFVGWQTLPLLRHAPRSAAGPRPSLGVIVAAYNEAAVLPATLAALAQQDELPDQIVLADDGSDDATAAVLAGHFGLMPPPVGSLSPPAPSAPRLRWLRLPHAGKAQALNAALQAIDTEVVMTVDADTLLERGACRAMRDAFTAEPELVAATGILTPVCGRTLSGRLFQWFQTYEYIRNFISRAAWMRADSLLLISGAFAGFRRESVLRVGGFDAACLVEDYELIHRLRRYAVEHGLSWCVRVLGTARAVTEAPGTLPAFLRQRRRWFAGFLQTQYWNRDMTGNRRYGKLGLMMLPVKAFDTLQPVYGLSAFALLLAFIAVGRATIWVPIFSVIFAKIALDFGFHLWSVHLYRRWTGDRSHTHLFYAFLASLIEPFSFQLLRHTGASLGWIQFLGGQRHWGVQQRVGVAAARGVSPSDVRD
jgi:cellulose synthase/poly-beta-1,6-N-acetylglucosamine synthase-like glycosyltransferase